MRFTIDEYSKRFKMSKEMVRSRLREKRLNYIIEEGVTYIIVPRSTLGESHLKAIEEGVRNRPPQPETTQAPRPPQGEDRPARSEDRPPDRRQGADAPRRT